jgi:hypothetical protein
MKKAEWSLRIGLAFSFIYAAIDALKNPADWVSFIPAEYTFFLNAYQALIILNWAQIILALWLLSGKRLAGASLVSILFFAGLLFFNWAGLDVLFRDVSLLFASIALYFLAKSN